MENLCENIGILTINCILSIYEWLKATQKIKLGLLYDTVSKEEEF